MAKIAIVFYSMYGHVRKLAEAEKAGIEKAGGKADLYQIKETLPKEILDLMHAPAQSDDIPILTDPATLEGYDAYLFGIPTRYGNLPAQWKAFWDSTGQQWQKGAYHGKMASLFISNATLGGGQESTALATMSTLAHHGIIYVPLGYAKAFADMADMTEIHGGSPWGAGTFAGADGSRQPSAKEISIATTQGEYFYSVVSKHFGCLHGGAEETDIAAVEKKEEASSSSTPLEKKMLKGIKEGPCGLPGKCTVS